MKKLGTLFVLFLSVIVLVACASGKKIQLLVKTKSCCYKLNHR